MILLLDTFQHLNVMDRINNRNEESQQEEHLMAELYILKTAQIGQSKRSFGVTGNSVTSSGFTGAQASTAAALSEQ